MWVSAQCSKCQWLPPSLCFLRPQHHHLCNSSIIQRPLRQHWGDGGTPCLWLMQNPLSSKMVPSLLTPTLHRLKDVPDNAVLSTPFDHSFIGATHAAAATSRLVFKLGVIRYAFLLLLLSLYLCSLQYNGRKITSIFYSSCVMLFLVL